MIHLRSWAAIAVGLALVELIGIAVIWHVLPGLRDLRVGVILALIVAEYVLILRLRQHIFTGESDH